MKFPEDEIAEFISNELTRKKAKIELSVFDSIIRKKSISVDESDHVFTVTVFENSKKVLKKSFAWSMESEPKKIPGRAVNVLLSKIEKQTSQNVMELYDVEPHQLNDSNSQLIFLMKEKFVAKEYDKKPEDYVDLDSLFSRISYHVVLHKESIVVDIEPAENFVKVYILDILWKRVKETILVKTDIKEPGKIMQMFVEYIKERSFLSGNLNYEIIDYEKETLLDKNNLPYKTKTFRIKVIS